MTLRWKLVLLYAVILALVIGGLAIMLVIQVKGTLFVSAISEVMTHAEALGGELEFEDGAWRIDPDSLLARQYAEATDRYYFVTERKEPARVILRSPSAPREERTQPPSGGAGIYSYYERSPRGFIEIGIGATKTAEPPAATESRPFEAIVFCGKSMAGMDATIAAIVDDLLIIGPLVLLASLAGGWFLVSRALRPIDRIAKTAAEINETDLSQRIRVQGRDELARLSTTLNATFDRLQRGFERERQFTADASHELRTPLAAITGNVEVALNKERSAAEYQEILGDVGEAAARMQAIVEGLLALARSDEKAAPRVREKVVLARLVEDAVRDHGGLAEQKHVSVSVAADDSLTVHGDAGHLRTVLSNLVANAIRYNVDGGRVGIEVTRNGTTARIWVDDTGIGIPEKDLPHVFERFYRVEQSRSSAGGGVGLGLAIAKAIVQAHHGTIAASRLPAGGTRFEVVLPV